MAKLSPAQRELIDALKNGARLHFLSGVDPRFFVVYAGTSAQSKRCSTTARALRDRGLIEPFNERYGSYQMRLTAEGKAQ